MKNVLPFILAVFALSACDNRSFQGYDETHFSSGIIGGTLVQKTDDSASFLVMIVDTDRGETCTGTLISKNAVLTAAHCLKSDAKAIHIYFGTNPFENEQAPMKNADEVFVHPDYLEPKNLDQTKPGNDLGIISFVGSLPENYAPIASFSSSQGLKKQTAIVATGFGRNNGLINDESNDNNGEGSLRAATVEVFDANESMGFFFVNQKNGKGVCPGDSGGPALIKINDQWAVAGVASALILSGNLTAKNYNYCEQSALYMDTNYYKSWIQTTLLKISSDLNRGIK